MKPARKLITYSKGYYAQLSEPAQFRRITIEKRKRYAGADEHPLGHLLRQLLALEVLFFSLLASVAEIYQAAGGREQATYDGAPVPDAVHLVNT